MTEKPLPNNTDSDGTLPSSDPVNPQPAQNASSDHSGTFEDADWIRRINGGRDHRAFLVEMAADLEAHFRSLGRLEEAERLRAARAILDTIVEPTYEENGIETLTAHDRLMCRYSLALGIEAGAQEHGDYLAARGETL